VPVSASGSSVQPRNSRGRPLGTVGLFMPVWRHGLGNVFDAFRANGLGCGRGGLYDSSHAVRVAGSAIEIKATLASDPFCEALHSLSMARLMVRHLRGLCRLNVATVRLDRCSSRKLQRQEREHQQDQKGAHEANFKRCSFPQRRERAISSVSSGCTSEHQGQSEHLKSLGTRPRPSTNVFWTGKCQLFESCGRYS
jgi:hypothetical protein